MRAVCSCLLLICSIVACASVPPGSWSWMGAWGRPVTQVVETPSKVYYLAGGNLCSFEKATDESVALTPDHGLSDSGIDFIVPDAQGKFIAAAYSSGNIDIVYEDGRTVALPDIRESSVITDKSIEAMEIAGNRLYAATKTHGIVFDIDKRKVITYGAIGSDIKALTVSGNRIFIVDGHDLKSCDSLSDLKSGSAWTLLGETPGIIELAADGDRLLGRSSAEVFAINPDNGEATRIGYSSQRFIRESGRVMVSEGNWVGTPPNLIRLPERAAGSVVGGLDPTSALWSLSYDGIESYAYAENGWTVTKQRFRPRTFATRDIGYMIPGRDGLRLYFTNVGLSHLRPMASPEGMYTYQATTLLADGNLSDVSATGVTPDPISASYPPGRDGRAGATTRLAEDPDDASTYWLGTGNDGLYKVTDGKFIGRFDSSNSPMGEPYGSRVYEVVFDRSGNLWVGADGETPDGCIMVLPAAARRKDISMVNRDDWKVIDTDGYANGKDIRIFLCSRSDVAFIFSDEQENCFLAYSTSGTPDNFNDDSRRLWKDVLDTDGKSFHPVHISSIAEDREGRVWIGTSEGVMVIDNPADALEEQLRVRRLKISHDDGTGLADYLAGTDLVLDISVDGADRKWLATQGSGLYLVNSEGNKVLRHFTESNSPMMSNTVNAVHASAPDNSVYIATPEGVLRYGGDASVPQAGFGNMRVFPNPVTPGYGGIVTVDGLTDGALVKIADSSGRVLWQGRAEGGLITWNLCGSSGRRVPSGIYFIMASPRDGASGKGAVGKLAVVN